MRFTTIERRPCAVQPGLPMPTAVGGPRRTGRILNVGVDLYTRELTWVAISTHGRTAAHELAQSQRSLGVHS